MSKIEWVACDAKTGVVITDLPGLSVDRISDAMNGYETASGVLRLSPHKFAPVPVYEWRPTGSVALNLFTNPRMVTTSGPVMVEDALRPGTFILA